MFRVITASLVTLALTGCMDSITKPSEPVDTSYYTIDLKHYTYCRGSTPTCHKLSMIASGALHLKPIEDIYDAKITGPNYRSSLLRMMLNPEGPYPVKKMSTNGRYYRLPVNQHTDTVWQAFENMKSSLYNDNVFTN
ncbi:hypothetical protein [Amphritea sp.]|uniref:hypothetical protein n=1 Tax=Amphritea sp. TaxID=1872502 RepID=UPI003A9230C6